MKHITIIEDDATTRDVLQMIFQASNYQVTLCENGAELIAGKLKKTDLFILDRYLPGHSGLQLCRHIKGTPEYAGTPVLMISGAHDIQQVACAAGADAVLPKPFRIKAMKEMVARVVTGKKNWPNEQVTT